MKLFGVIAYIVGAILNLICACFAYWHKDNVLGNTELILFFILLDNANRCLAEAERAKEAIR